MLMPGFVVITLQDVRILVTAILKYTERIICDWVPESERLDLIFNSYSKPEVIYRHSDCANHIMDASGDH
ncbi:hypothetical protein L9F63_000469 [Diploptera punctata]|uniref:Uncharacterized protein n=1 Tax=Diploptera punctata TaxID=6984 RepID=A0AAD8ESP0_DIPPU|nr:hypothetical protein L9F63_000469 [Diploptera punctata]